MCLAASASGANPGTADAPPTLTLNKGQRVFGSGTPFDCLYLLCEGECKTERGIGDGQTQVTGFYQPGEILGLDALAGDSYCSDAIALSECTLCRLPYGALLAAMGRLPALRAQFQQLMGSEIARLQANLLLLGHARAPRRLAALLLDLASRRAAPGRMCKRFRLSMSREDIAAYLGLSGESVSRLLSALRADGVLRVRNREIELLDVARLRRLAAPEALA